MLIGLEIHLQIWSDRKLFSVSPTNQTGSFDTGMPGAMPMFDDSILDKVIEFTHLLHCKNPKCIYFDRKHYDYPDLPHGYQITQYHQPIGKGGYISTSSGKRYYLKQVHLESDAGSTKDHVVNWNRAGNGLVEVVLEPFEYVKEEIEDVIESLRILSILSGLSLCRMHEGEMRFDVNFSKIGVVRQEVKNLNSIQALKDALASAEEIQTCANSYTWRFIEHEGIVKTRGKGMAESYHYIREYDIPVIRLPKVDLKECLQRFEFRYSIFVTRIGWKYTQIMKALHLNRWLLNIENYESIYGEGWFLTLMNLCVVRNIPKHIINYLLDGRIDINYVKRNKNLSHVLLREREDQFLWSQQMTDLVNQKFHKKNIFGEMVKRCNPKSIEALSRWIKDQ